MTVEIKVSLDVIDEIMAALSPEDRFMDPKEKYDHLTLLLRSGNRLKLVSDLILPEPIEL